MPKTISKDVPLNEITLRRYEKPNLKDRDLVRKLCLSIGLLQPGDSRDVVVDVFYVLLKEKKELNSEEIRDKVISLRKQKNLKLLGVASSNVRRQLKRLRDVFLVEKVVNNYRINENLSLNEIMEEKLEKFLMPSVIGRVKDYFKAVDEEFSK
jgi:DNA-binding transcriptional ArsR family regulator